MNITSDLRVSVTLIMAPVSIVGVFINLLSALCILKLRSFHNSFGYLTAFHALSDASLLFIFAVWSTPMTLLRISPSYIWLNETFGSLSIFFQHMSFHSSLTIAVNRFLAITFPVIYRNFFTTKIVIMVLGGITVYSLVYWLLFFFDGCKFYFDDQTIIWQFANTPCGNIIGLYIDFYYCVGLFILESFLDIVTLVQLILANIAAANTMVYVLEITTFHVVNPLMTTPFLQFLTTTFAWACGHLGGGVVLVVFNGQIRRRMLNPANLFVTETQINMIKVTATRPQISDSGGR